MPFPLPTEHDDPARLHDLVARRAQEIWNQLGCPDHQDLAIWLEAEAEIRAMQEKAFRHPHCPIHSA